MNFQKGIRPKDGLKEGARLIRPRLSTCRIRDDGST
jgi:hypothetical protein